MMVYRLCYSVSGRLAFLSHLELLRLWQRTILRTGLEVAWSQGYNPRPKISTGPARGVGIIGQGEYLDVEFRGFYDAAQVEAALAAALPAEVELLRLRELPAGVKNLEAVINEAVYSFRFIGGLPAELPARTADFMARDSVPFTRHSPKGDKELDLRAYVREMAIADDRLLLTVAMGPRGSLRPQELLTALGYWDIIGNVEITRCGLYIREGSGRTQP